MSVQRSNPQLRNRVHVELTALLRTGGPLGVAPKQLRAFLAGDALLVDVAHEYRSLATNVAIDGRAVIITAGPPGAGKSSAIASLVAEHRRIDSDEIKDLLLVRAEADGLLAVRRKHILVDGDPVGLGELAGWVHRASTDIADIVRIESLLLGENIVVEGTLAWNGLITQYPRELAEYDYENLTVLDVEVPRAVAIEQARDRWWRGRTSNSAIGGRFLPDAAFAFFYPDTDAVSVCAIRARELYAAGNAVGVDTRLVFIGRNARGMQRSALVTPNGIAPWSGGSPSDTANVGVVCTRCGRPLSAPESVARGMGEECARA